MEKKTIGKFISALRKANGMTQRELGEKLFVSDKTVSRWERDECTPELSLIPAIAEIFGITADELLRGERNNPDREATASEDTAGKQRAKSDKQFKLMLHDRKKKYTNTSLISIGLTIVGLIAAMICDLGFQRGLLGFCLASVFFVAAAICQICFTVSFRLLVDEEDTEHAEEIKKANTHMALGSVKIFFGIFLTLAFCLPTAVLTLTYFDSYWGLNFDSWLLYGALFAAAAFLIAFCIYKIFVLKILISKEAVWLEGAELDKANVDSRLLKKLCIIFAIAFAVITAVICIVSSSVDQSTLTERERFDDPDKFIEYMQSEYDAWYEEGYGDWPQSEIPDPEPSKKWDEIDGKDYYYCEQLYHSVTAIQHDSGEWEIVVKTKEAYQKGKTAYNILQAGFLSLYVIALAVCVVWYLCDARKRQKTEKLKKGVDKATLP